MCVCVCVKSVQSGYNSQTHKDGWSQIVLTSSHTPLSLECSASFSSRLSENKNQPASSSPLFPAHPFQSRSIVSLAATPGHHLAKVNAHMVAEAHISAARLIRFQPTAPRTFTLPSCSKSLRQAQSCLSATLGRQRVF